MFDPTLFVSPFWSWFIIILTSVGIIGVFWLIRWMSTDRPKPDQKIETMGHVWDENLEELSNPLPLWWLGMFYITLVFGIIYLLLYPGMGSFAGLLNWTEIKEYNQEMKAAEVKYQPLYDRFKSEPVETLVNNPDALNIGHRLYMTYCTVCHGSDAGGGPGFPNLRDADWLYGGEPTAIKTTITAGRQGMMPTAQQNGLNEADITHVVEYILKISNNQHDLAAAEQGQAVYGRICIACHGPDGKGMAAVGAPNLTDNIWLYNDGNVLRDSITKTVTHGRQGKMPAHGTFLGEAKVHLLTAYIYNLPNTQK